jgi:hypothetical protein
MNGTLANLPLLVAAALALGVIAGAWISLRSDTPLLLRVARVLLQLLVAVMFWCLLFPPPSAWRADVLTVLTAGDAGVRLPIAQDVIALPEASHAHVARVPDLATALRERPALRRIKVFGDGLSPRDLPAAANLQVHFVPTPLHGIVELQAPQRVRVGQSWTVRGRLAAPAVQVELYDPAGAVVDRARVDAQARFELSATAPVTGRLAYQLRSFDAQQHGIDRAVVPLIGEGGVALGMLVRAGAPSPELKYWQRWAHDAGITLASTIDVSDGLQIHAGDASFNAAALARADLAVIDERAWLMLGDEEKSVLLAAVDQGLGLLLRVTGPLEPAVLDAWCAFGFTLEPQDEPHSVALPAPFSSDAATTFTAAALRIAGGVPILRDATGAPLVLARDHGAGRIAVSVLLDSYRLQLAGASGRYGAWWAQLIGELARPRPRAVESGWPDPAWGGERIVLCDVGDDAQVRAPSGTRTALLRDGACAAFWPVEAGWHQLADASGVRDFYVRPADDAAGLRQARDRDATQALADASAPLSSGARGPARRPVPRWPLLLVWLPAVTLLWWLERPALAGGRR